MPIIQKCFIIRKVTKNLQISVQRKLPFLHLVNEDRLIYYAKMKRILIFFTYSFNLDFLFGPAHGIPF